MQLSYRVTTDTLAHNQKDVPMKERNDRPEVDSLLPDVDEEMRSSESRDESAPSTNDDMTADQPTDMSASGHSAEDTGEHDDKSALAQQLDVLMDGPDAPYAHSAPDLPARSNGYLSKEVERALQQAVSVLKNRYSKVSKSLLMDYAIRAVLWDLRENAEDSQMVEWLDTVLGDRAR